MARAAMKGRFSVRMPEHMERWVVARAKRDKVAEADVLRAGVKELMAQEGADAMRRRILGPACSCSPDDRAKDGCRCGAEVSP